MTARTHLRLTGHDFDGDRILREFDLEKLEQTSKGFQYNVFQGDKKKNEERYVKVGDAIATYIQSLMRLRPFSLKQFAYYFRSVSCPPKLYFKLLQDLRLFYQFLR